MTNQVIGYIMTAFVAGMVLANLIWLMFYIFVFERTLKRQHRQIDRLKQLLQRGKDGR